MACFLLCIYQKITGLFRIKVYWQIIIMQLHLDINKYKQDMSIIAYVRNEKKY